MIEEALVEEVNTNADEKSTEDQQETPKVLKGTKKNRWRVPQNFFPPIDPKNP